MSNLPKEAMAFRLALERAQISQASIARKVGVTSGMVWQWLNGNRPIPAKYAPGIAEILKVPPESISSAYMENTRALTAGGSVAYMPGTEGEESRRPDLVIRRLENDVDALRYALAGLVTAMVVHRPAEAAEVARLIGRSVPVQFRERGFVRELLTTLESAAKGSKG